MNSDQIEWNVFLRQAEKLKDVLTTAYTASGKRESTAEHSWRLCLMAMVFESAFADLDILKLLKICIVHDLGEAIAGEIPAIAQHQALDKSGRERRDLVQLLTALDAKLRTHILSLWDEYENASSPEGLIAQGLDKLETILQHNYGRNPAGFNYGFNLSYGRKQTSAQAQLAATGYWSSLGHDD